MTATVHLTATERRRRRRRRCLCRGRPLRTGALTLAAAAALSLAGSCASDDGGDGDGGGPPPSPAPEARSSAPQASPSPSPSPSDDGRSPFTGEKSANTDGVLAVKFDNAPAARPPAGLEDAALVYVEKVEGGLSRLMAVYDDPPADAIGPVRSARESDLELLRQFGRPAFAYSGVRSSLKDDLAKAPLHPVSPAQAGGAYERGGGRPAPHNLFAAPRELLDAAPKASTPRDVGFRFSTDPPEGGERRGSASVRYPAARFAFDWSGEAGAWQVSMDGRPARTAGGARLSAPTVVLQEVGMRPSRWKDVTGARTPYIESTGEGRATVLRDGRAYDGRWSRPSPDDGTAFTTPDGDPLPFDRGPVWIVYAQR